MATMLTISRDAVVRAAGLTAGDTTDEADATQVIADGQAAYEAEIEGVALGNPTWQPLLTWLVTELLAADLLDQRARSVGASETIQGAGILIAPRRAHGPELRQRAGERLAPFRRRVAAAFVSEGSTPGVTHASQEALYGRAEVLRHAAAAG